MCLTLNKTLFGVFWTEMAEEEEEAAEVKLFSLDNVGDDLDKFDLN
jgi:hypothetical protein